MGETLKRYLTPIMKTALVVMAASGIMLFLVQCQKKSADDKPPVPTDSAHVRLTEPTQIPSPTLTLLQLAQQRPAEEWLALLANADEREADYAAKVIKEIGPEALPLLNEAMKNYDSTARQRLSRLLADFGMQGKPLLCKLAQDMDRLVSYAALESMGSLGQGCIPELQKALHDKDLLRRGIAADAISLLGKDAKGMKADLRKMLKDKEAFPRQAAAAALKTIEMEEAGMINVSRRCRQAEYGLERLPKKDEQAVARRLFAILSPGEPVKFDGLGDFEQGIGFAMAGWYIIEKIVPFPLEDRKYSYFVLVWDNFASHASGYEILGWFIPEELDVNPLPPITDQMMDEHVNLLEKAREIVDTGNNEWHPILRSEDLELVGLIDIESDGICEFVISHGWQHYGIFQGDDQLWRYNGKEMELVLDFEVRSRFSDSEMPRNCSQRLTFTDFNKDGFKDMILSSFASIEGPAEMIREDKACGDEGVILPMDLEDEFPDDDSDSWFTRRYFRHEFFMCRPGVLEFIETFVNEVK